VIGDSLGPAPSGSAAISSMRRFRASYSKWVTRPSASVIAITLPTASYAVVVTPSSASVTLVRRSSSS
jgi:hypothetical protein